jgi:hypothetical protein
MDQQSHMLWPRGMNFLRRHGRDTVIWEFRSAEVATHQSKDLKLKLEFADIFGLFRSLIVLLAAMGIYAARRKSNSLILFVRTASAKLLPKSIFDLDFSAA